MIPLKTTRNNPGAIGRMLLAGVVLWALTLPGCGPRIIGGGGPDGYGAAPALSRACRLQIANALRDEIRGWKGVPYKWGGADKRGTDCSGFVATLYRELFETPLPRTTRRLAHAGVPVDAGDARPGDLVFFKMPWGKRHVGIYLGEFKFVHASAGRGVAVSSFEEKYWRRRYWQARRVLVRFPDACPG